MKKGDMGRVALSLKHLKCQWKGNIQSTILVRILQERNASLSGQHLKVSKRTSVLTF